MASAPPIWAQVHTVDADGTTNFLDDVTFAGALTESVTTSKIVPGATSWSVRNHADTLDNLLITDIGKVTIAPQSAIGSNAGSVVVGQLTNTTTVPDNTTSVNFLRLMATFAGTTNAPSGNSARALYSESHYSDNVNGLATLAGGYFQAYHDGTGSTVTDHFALIGRTYVTSTGTATNMWGVRGDVHFTGAGTGVDVMSLWGRFPTQFAGSSLTNWYGLRVDQVNFSTTTAANAYGANIGVPASATGHKVGVWIGPILDAGTTYTVGLASMSSGAWVKGNPTLPPPADTSNSQAVLALVAGDNAGANTVNALLYFYRNQTNQGYIGYTSSTASTVAGHAKVVGDLALVSDSKCLIDVSGQIWSNGKISATTQLAVVTTALTSGNLPTMLSLASAAHTGLNNTATQEVFISLAFTKTFTGGGADIATMYGVNITRSTYAAAAAQIITDAATVRIQGAPVQGTNMTLTNTYALILGGALRLDTNVANAAVASVMTANVGPTGAHTAIQEWFVVYNASGVARYIPAW